MHLLTTYYKKNKYEAGTDEAGRGCLAGPVFAAAVILNKRVHIQDMDDSKKLSHNQRVKLRRSIESNALSYAVRMVSAQEIDQINILQASLKAMRLAIEDLEPNPDFVLVDGNKFIPQLQVPQQWIIQGDSKYASIAAASILAKTYRDEYMDQLHESYPHYRWNQNKAYATALHRRAILDHGPCVHHRRSFLNKILEPKLF